MTYDVHCVWLRHVDPEYIELALARDEFQIDANYDGWEAAVAQVRADYPNCETRIQVVRVPGVESLFGGETTVDGEVVA